MELIFKNKKIELTSSCYEYLYPYLVRFLIKHKIDRTQWNNGKIFIPDEYKNSFINMLKSVFTELLQECYVEPTHKQRSKYSTCYKKIEFDGRIYVLNYRADIVGIIGYALDYLISETEQ